MKIAWSNKATSKRPPATNLHLPFKSDSDDDDDDDEGEETEKKQGGEENANPSAAATKPQDSGAGGRKRLFESLQSQGNRLAEDGKYHEALSKWEAALTLMPDDAILHEQKAQVLLELGDAWSAVKAASRATQLKPVWPEAWLTLGRAQLNFGEPDSAIETLDKALTIKPDYDEAKVDRETAVRLVKKRRQLHSSGLSANKRRYTVTEKGEEAKPE